MTTPNAEQKAKETKFTVLNNGDVIADDCAILWTNFGGAESDKRTFGLALSEEIALYLKDKGWNVKCRPSQREGGDPLYYTEIVIRMDSKWPPVVTKISEYRGRRTEKQMTEEDLGDLDSLNFSYIYAKIHPYNHGRVNSAGSTVKGYLSTMELWTESTEAYHSQRYLDWAHSQTEDEEVPFN